MANGVFNISKGSVVEKIRDDPDLVFILLLKTNETEIDMVDHVTVDALLAAAGNEEADFTNYARKTAITGVIDIDDATNRVSVDLPDQTWANAGGDTNNTLTKLIVAYTGAGSGIPMTHHDFSYTTNGSSLPAVFNEEGFFRAT